MEVKRMKIEDDLHSYRGFRFWCEPRDNDEWEYHIELDKYTVESITVIPSKNLSQFHKHIPFNVAVKFDSILNAYCMKQHWDEIEAEEAALELEKQKQ